MLEKTEEDLPLKAKNKNTLKNKSSELPSRAYSFWENAFHYHWWEGHVSHVLKVIVSYSTLSPAWLGLK